MSEPADTANVSIRPPIAWAPVVAREEAYLERKFGKAYRHYRARVRRWL